MGLDIISEDGKKSFHITYFGFTNMRLNFLLSQDILLYEAYKLLMRTYIMIERNELIDDLDEIIQKHTPNDLLILINHSDVDGELSPLECERLFEILNVDENLIRIYQPENYEGIVKKMYEFLDILKYGFENDVKLIFG